MERQQALSGCNVAHVARAGRSRARRTRGDQHVYVVSPRGRIARLAAEGAGISVSGAEPPAEN